MMHEYCEDIVHEYLVHLYCAMRRVHRGHGDVCVHDDVDVHGLSPPCGCELGQYRCQFHDCDGDGDQDRDGQDHRVQQN